MYSMDAAINAFITLIVVVDPIGTTPLFIALTGGLEAKARRKVALRASSVALALLILFALAGESVLGFFGISLPAFRIAGGLLLFLTAIDMLFETRTERRERRAAEESQTPHDPSVFPLAIPMIAGPGSIAAVILLMGSLAGDMRGQATVLGVVTAVVLLQLAMFLIAGPVAKLLGRTGVVVVTRLMGMLLAALSVQFVLDGIFSLPQLSGL